MVVICLGPVCLPLWPVIALTVKPLWDKVLPDSWKQAIVKFWAALLAMVCPKRSTGKSKPHKQSGGSKASVKHITSRADYENAINKSESQPIIIKFTADFCAPCKLIAPEFEKHAQRLHAKMGFYELDIETLDSLALEVGVSSIPAFHVISAGKKLDGLVGGNIDKLESFVNKHAKYQKKDH